ncbi:hypothetical protein CEXT_299521 [Caerostris extrusa]|uniref:Uncharacterized protein n=1 Tax=Caerostris extrusa TaxID=172846 RepID=A0AAV4SAL3_CAEEX|nr:hypothetical protein CEXT_299521 [Caerostris extrusa]
MTELQLVLVSNRDTISHQDSRLHDPTSAKNKAVQETWDPFTQLVRNFASNVSGPLKVSFARRNSLPWREALAAQLAAYELPADPINFRIPRMSQHKHGLRHASCE